MNKSLVNSVAALARVRTDDSKLRVLANAATIFATVILILPQAAHAQRAGEVLVGRWQIDAAKSREAGGDRVEEELIKLNVEIAFEKDGKFGVIIRSDPKQERQNARWKVLRDDGKTVLIEITHGADNRNEFIVTYLEGSFIRIEPTKESGNKEPPFVLRRLK